MEAALLDALEVAAELLCADERLEEDALVATEDRLEELARLVVELLLEELLADEETSLLREDEAADETLDAEDARDDEATDDLEEELEATAIRAAQKPAELTLPLAAIVWFQDSEERMTLSPAWVQLAFQS